MVPHAALILFSAYICASNLLSQCLCLHNETQDLIVLGTLQKIILTNLPLPEIILEFPGFALKLVFQILRVIEP